jgi:hypothetical protein
MVPKLLEIGSGFFIPDPDPDFLPIPDPGVKKAPDPGSGSATLNYTIVIRTISMYPRNCIYYEGKKLGTAFIVR